MPRFVPAAALAVAAFTAAVAFADDKKEEKGEVLKTVVDVTYDFDKEKKALTVTAVGEVPTGGWSGAKLTLRKSKDAPADGVYEYDLTAVRPTGVVTQIVSKVKASDTWENPPADVKGVKVYGVGDGAKTVKVVK